MLVYVVCSSRSGAPHYVVLGRQLHQYTVLYTTRTPSSHPVTADDECQCCHFASLSLFCLIETTHTRIVIVDMPVDAAVHVHVFCLYKTSQFKLPMS